jgi:hypothetical protein
VRHEIRKFFGTLRIAGLVILARTFGRYVNSGWDGCDEYAQYEWGGQEHRIPMFRPPIKMTEDELLAALRADLDRTANDDTISTVS